MKKIELIFMKICTIFMIFILNVQVAEAVVDNESKTAKEMVTILPEFETDANVVLSTLASARGSEQVDSGLCFSTAEEAISFGKYFYRYCYYGQETVTLSYRQVSDGYRIYVMSETPHIAYQQHIAVEKILQEVVAQARGMDIRKKVDLFYEWVYSRTTYDKQQCKNTIYDAVMDGESACWGYTFSFLELCRMAEIESEPVYGGLHSWNRAKIDGEWLYFDITWDKLMGTHKLKFLSRQQMEEIHKDLTDESL